MEQSRGTPEDHARSQRQWQHRVRHEDDEQEVPDQADPVTRPVLEPDPRSEDSCRSHNKYTTCFKHPINQNYNETGEWRMRVTLSDEQKPRGARRPVQVVVGETAPPAEEADGAVRRHGAHGPRELLRVRE